MPPELEGEGLGGLPLARATARQAKMPPWLARASASRCRGAYCGGVVVMQEVEMHATGRQVDLQRGQA